MTERTVCGSWSPAAPADDRVLPGRRCPTGPRGPRQPHASARSSPRSSSRTRPPSATTSRLPSSASRAAPGRPRVRDRAQLGPRPPRRCGRAGRARRHDRSGARLVPLEILHSTPSTYRPTRRAGVLGRPSGPAPQHPLGDRGMWRITRWPRRPSKPGMTRFGRDGSTLSRCSATCSGSRVLTFSLAASPSGWFVLFSSSNRGVRVFGGHSVATRMSRGCNSRRRASLNPTTASLGRRVAGVAVGTRSAPPSTTWSRSCPRRPRSGAARARGRRGPCRGSWSRSWPGRCRAGTRRRIRRAKRPWTVTCPAPRQPAPHRGRGFVAYVEPPGADRRRPDASRASGWAAPASSARRSRPRRLDHKRHAREPDPLGAPDHERPRPRPSHGCTLGATLADPLNGRGPTPPSSATASRGSGRCRSRRPGPRRPAGRGRSRSPLEADEQRRPPVDLASSIVMPISRAVAMPIPISLPTLSAPMTGRGSACLMPPPSPSATTSGRVRRPGAAGRRSRGSA